MPCCVGLCCVVLCCAVCHCGDVLCDDVLQIGAPGAVVAVDRKLNIVS